MPINIKNTMAIAFKLPPKKAIEYLKSKAGNIVTSLEWEAYVKLYGAQAHRDAFTVANVAKADIIQTVLDELNKAQANGSSLDEFKKDTVKRITDAGWTGLKPSRLTTIYNTNLQIAYANGQYNSLTQLGKESERKYWRYSQVQRDTSNVGHSHFNGLIYPADDPIWKYIFPPCGYNCKCRVTAYTQAELDKLNFTVSDSAKGIDYVKKNKKYFPFSATNSFKPDTTKYDSKLKLLVDRTLSKGA